MQLPYACSGPVFTKLLDEMYCKNRSVTQDIKMERSQGSGSETI